MGFYTLSHHLKPVPWGGCLWTKHLEKPCPILQKNKQKKNQHVHAFYKVNYSTTIIKEASKWVRLICAKEYAEIRRVEEDKEIWIGDEVR